MNLVDCNISLVCGSCHDLLPRPLGAVEKPVIEGLDFVGTGLVPVLTQRRTATLRAERTQCEARAVPTITSPS